MDISTNIFLISFASLITSAITAVTGMGGGLLLIAILPSLLPPNAVIPIHGVAQLSSNLSRFVLDIKDTCIKPVALFSIGSLFGAYFGASLLSKINLNLLPLFISVFILFIIWLPISEFLKRIPGKYLSIGVIQTALSLYVGATGPISASVLISDGYNSNQVIVSNAAINTVINTIKSIVFFMLGFSFSEYYIHIFSMIICAVIGSFLGSKIRKSFDEKIVKMTLKIIISLFCLKNIILFIYTKQAG